MNALAVLEDQHHKAKQLLEKLHGVRDAERRRSLIDALASNLTERLVIEQETYGSHEALSVDLSYEEHLMTTFWPSVASVQPHGLGRRALPRERESRQEVRA